MVSAHDQLYKELIRAFPVDFVELVIPDIAAQIDLEALDFRHEEYFTDSPRGGRPRRPDLAAQVPTQAGDGDVILHTEIEARYRSARVPRLFDYNRLLSRRYGLPVHTVVVYCRGGLPGVQRNRLRVESLGRIITVFDYDSLGVTRASAAAYLARRSPLAWAFAALMRPGGIGS